MVRSCSHSRNQQPKMILVANVFEKFKPPPPPPENSSKLETWNDWFEYSSFHGIVDVSRSGYGKCWKVCWILVMMVFTAMTIYTVQQSIVEYIENPTVQEYKLERMPQFKLPDLILCTRQQFNTSKLRQMGASNALINGLVESSYVGGVFAMLGQFNNLPYPTTVDSLRLEYENFLIQNGHPTFDDLLSRTSIDCTRLVQFCSWSRSCCDQAQRVNHNGQCYRLSPGPNQTQSYPGPGSGIQLIVKGHFNDEDEIRAGVIKGILIDIVYPNEWMTYSYQQVPIGVAATIHLSLQRTQRLNLIGRAERCRERQTNTDTCANTMDVLKSTANGCYYAAWATVYNRYCHCNPLAGINSSDWYEPLGPTCHPFPGCLANIDKINEETRTLQAQLCLPECDHYDYKTWITYGTFDTELYKKLWTQGGAENELDENTILLDIYHPTMEYVNVREVETYTFITLLSNIGGAAGLWLGASLMSFLQFGFYFTKWISLKVSRRK